MNVALINTTPDAEGTIAFCARVSSAFQDNPEYEKLFKYLIDHKHWSPFEMADMTVSITTSRAIAQQILRHKSFSFQEFSQRYAKAAAFEEVELRLQGDSKQGSGDVVKNSYTDIMVEFAIASCESAYRKLVEAGVSRETARMILPLCTQTKMYMKGSVRSWMHYLRVRTSEETQKEHRQLAEEIAKIFIEQFPITSKALGWA